MQRVAIDAAISDLEQWQRRFDPSWFLIMRIADPVIDQQLAAQKTEQEQSDNGNASCSSTVDPKSSSNNVVQSPIALATNLRDALCAEPRQQISVFLPPLEVERLNIPFSSAQAAKRGEQWFIIERYACQDGRSLSAHNEDVRTLARKLATADPWTFGLLNCKGVIKLLDPQRRQIQGFVSSSVFPTQWKCFRVFVKISLVEKCTIPSPGRS